MKQEFFNMVIGGATRHQYEDFIRDICGADTEIRDLRNNKFCQEAIQRAREIMESSEPLNPFQKLIKIEEILDSDNYQEARKAVLEGNVAAIDGTPVLPNQKTVGGQLFMCAVGSITARRHLQSSSMVLSSKVTFENLNSFDDYVQSVNLSRNDGSWATAAMQYFEINHASEISENYIFLDGNLIPENLQRRKLGRNMLSNLLDNHEKRAIGIVKNISGATPITRWFANALKPGEIFIIQTQFDHLQEQPAVRERLANTAEGKWVEEYGKRILRGVYKPFNKAFGFQVQERHFEEMIAMVIADTDENTIGHEIPFLLNQVDQQLRALYPQTLTSEVVANSLLADGEEIFFEEQNERSFR